MSLIKSILSGRFILAGGKDEPNEVQPVAPAPTTKPPTSKRPVLVEVPQDKEKAGYVMMSCLNSLCIPIVNALARLFVTEELEAAYQRVKTRVEDIARECRARNQRYR